MRSGRQIAFVAALFAGLAAAAPVGAQVYRSVGPDGRVLYSDRPPADAREARVIEAPPAPPAPPAGANARRAEENRQYQQLLQRGREQSAATDRARAEMDAAQTSLEQARKRLTEGAEPAPGERLGTAGGASRLGDAYFERQAALERAVREAEERLTKAQQAYGRLR